MTYEEYRAARDAEEAEAEAKRKADREAWRAAELAKTPEQRQAELEAMPFEERYAREKLQQALTASIYRTLEQNDRLGASLTEVNERIASADLEPRRTWLERVLPEKHRWFLWLWLGAAFWAAGIVEYGR